LENNLKTYTLITYTNGGVDFSENHPTLSDKNVAMVALSLSNDKSVLIVNNCKDGEISGYQNIDSKIRVFSIEGRPKLNLLLFCHGKIILPNEKDEITARISADKIYKTLQDAVNEIDKE